MNNKTLEISKGQAIDTHFTCMKGVWLKIIQSNLQHDDSQVIYFVLDIVDLTLLLIN